MPATKTFTNQVITFLYLAYRMAGKDTTTLEHVPDLMQETLRRSARSRSHRQRDQRLG